MAQMMGDSYHNVEPLTAILDTVGIRNPKRRNRDRVILAPVDEVSCTEKLATRVNSYAQTLASDSFSGGKEVCVTGQIDKDAAKKFTRRGWMVREKVKIGLVKALTF
jgi:hypothetical protein